MLYTIFKILLFLLICSALIIKIVFMGKEIKELKKKNVDLLRENRHLMQHNGKLFDANQELKKHTDNKNIPSFDHW